MSGPKLPPESASLSGPMSPAKSASMSASKSPPRPAPPAEGSHHGTEPDLPPTPKRPDSPATEPPSGIHNTPTKRRRLATSLGVGRPRTEPGTGSLTSSGSHKSKKDIYVESVKPDEWVEEQLRHMRRDLHLAEEALSKLEGHIKPDSDELVGLLRRHLAVVKEDRKVWNGRGSSLVSFSLRSDFSKLWSDHPIASYEQLPEPKSHHPLHLTACESLVFLQSFAPLSFEGEYFTASRFKEKESESPADVLRHCIKVTARPPFQGLFTANIEVDSNIKTLAVEHVACSELEPAAVKELQDFITGVCDKKIKHDRNPAVKMNLTVLGWGMAEWLRVAVRRAKLWKTVDKDLLSFECDQWPYLAAMCADLMGPNLLKSSRGKEPSLVFDRTSTAVTNRDCDFAPLSFLAADDSWVFQSEFTNSSALAQSDLAHIRVTAKSLMEYMGKDSMVFRVPLLTDGAVFTDLEVKWSIQFDWTGHAQSKISINVKNLPPQWRRIDNGRTFDKLSKMFEDWLFLAEDPFHALCRIIALLAHPETEPIGEKKEFIGKKTEPIGKRREPIVGRKQERRASAV